MSIKTLKALVIIVPVVLAGCDTQAPGKNEAIIRQPCGLSEDSLMSKDPEELYLIADSQTGDPDIDPREPLRCVNELLKLRPNMAKAHALRGTLHRSLSLGPDGPTDEHYIRLAIKDFTEAFEKGFGYEALYERGLLWNALGKWDKAIEDFTAVIENTSLGDSELSIAAYGQRCHAYEMAGEYKKAIADYEVYIALEEQQGAGDWLERLRAHVAELKEKTQNE